ncbi:MAG: hypothetical protein AAGM67_12865, partial [Bacteroidota bacterium]
MFVTGAIKQSGPDQTALAYWMRVNNDGYVVNNAGLTTTQLNSAHEINANSICIDESGNFLIAGSSAQQPGVPGRERTLHYLSGQGKINWSVGQAEHDFVSVIWDNANARFVALSNNEGSSNPTTDIMLSLWDANGVLLNHQTLQTPTEDEAVALKAVDGGYVVVANSDIASQRQILLASFDSDLNVLWANQFSVLDFAHDVQGLAFDDDEYLMVSGTATEAGTNDSYGFLMGVDIMGNPVFDYVYTMDGDEQIAFTGLAHYRTNIDGRANGFLISGSYHDPARPDERRSLIVNLRADGSEIWARTYSVYPSISDLEFDEVLSDVHYLRSRQEFATVGVFHERIKSNGETRKKMIMMVRANVVNGQIDVQQGDCSELISLQAYSQSVAVNPLVPSLYQSARDR